MTMQPRFERACVLFCTIDVANPVHVGLLMDYLWWDHRQSLIEILEKDGASGGRADSAPEDTQDDLLSRCLANRERIDQAAEDGVIAREPSLEDIWYDDAPRKRMVRLLWRLLQNVTNEGFDQRFTADLAYFVEDAAQCRELLSPIQERLRTVLQAFDATRKQSLKTGQASFGEPFFLPPKEAAIVREQLRRAHMDLLEKSSDYREAVLYTLNHLVTWKCKFIPPPCSDLERIYQGQIVTLPSGTTHRSVWILSKSGQQHPMADAGEPYPARPGDFAWGYPGGGPTRLARSILADASGGNLEVAERCLPHFRDEVIAELPMSEPFTLPMQQVLTWLNQHDIDLCGLADDEARLRSVRESFSSRIHKWEAILEETLLAQRFDVVPPDFECALYVDLMELIQAEGAVMHCAQCRLPISSDGSSRAKRQHPRWAKGQPVYHSWCFVQVQRSRRADRYRRWAQKPEAQERRRADARRRRQKRLR